VTGNCRRSTRACWSAMAVDTTRFSAVCHDGPVREVTLETTVVIRSASTRKCAPSFSGHQARLTTRRRRSGSAYRHRPARARGFARS
jgi:hypothetical protein